MLHDNFDSDWKPGDVPHGTMVFTNVQPPVSPPPRNLSAEIDLINIKLAAIEKGVVPL